MTKFKQRDLINKLGMSQQEAEMVMKAQKIFPELLTTQGEGFCVDGRKIYEELKAVDKFADWIKSNLEKINAEKDIDFSVRFKPNGAIGAFTEEDIQNMSPQKRSSYGISEEYSLTLDAAKEIAMIAGSSNRANETLKHNSKLIRKYFILLENSIKKMSHWVIIREPQKQGYKEMCIVIERKHRELNDNQDPNRFVYSNNADMINVALFGHKSKVMKDILEVEQNCPLRENLRSEANHALYQLQLLNISLLESNLDMATRKLIITNTCNTRFLQLRIKVIATFSEEINKIEELNR